MSRTILSHPRLGLFLLLVHWVVSWMLVPLSVAMFLVSRLGKDDPSPSTDVLSVGALKIFRILNAPWPLLCLLLPPIAAWLWWAKLRSWSVAAMALNLAWALLIGAGFWITLLLERAAAQ